MISKSSVPSLTIKMPDIKFKISGVVYEVDSDIFDTEPTHSSTNQGFLPELVKTAIQNGDCLEFKYNRPHETFGAILGFYQTGELHMPMLVCPKAFRKELDFWGINTTYLQSCCKAKYNSFMDEHELVSEFHHELYDDDGSQLSGLTLRQRVWLIVDNQSKSLLAQMYFGITLIAVLISIIGIGLGTDPCCYRDVTTCELKEYLKSAKPMGYEKVLKKIHSEDCDEKDIARYFDSEDDVYYYLHSKPPHKPVKIPKLHRRLFVFDVIDYVTLVFFTFDFIFRIATCPSKLAFLRSVVNYFDFFALIGTYLHLILSNLNKQEIYEDNWIDALEYFQVLRSLRLLRLVKNLRTSRVLVFSLRKNFKDLSILAMFLFIGVCTFGSLLYFTEERSVVLSIPTGWWWSLVTMTTVGYGDVAPSTGPGRIIGSFCALSGVVLLSLTLPIFVNNFLTLYQHADVEEREHLQKLKDKPSLRITPVKPFELNGNGKSDTLK